MPSKKRARGEDSGASVLTRGLVLVFWSFVFWGTLLSGVLVWNVLTRGWSASVPLLRPQGFEGWVNLLLIPFALSVWCAVGFLASLRPRRRPS